MRVRILHIINDLSIGGSEMMLYRLLSRMDRNSFDPVVLSLTNSDELYGRIEALHVPIFTAGIASRLAPVGGLRRVRRLASEINADLIQGWMYHGSLAALFVRACSTPPARVLWGIRNSISTPRQERKLTGAVIRLGAALSRRPEGIVYVSHANRAQHEALGYRNANNHVIGNGFDTSLFAPSPEFSAELRSELGCSGDEILIGMIGRYHPVKAHEVFLAAAARLQNDPRLTFVMCGKGVDSSNSALLAQAGKLGILERIRLLGERHDVPRVLAGLDILACSSHNEASPNVIGEAMSCGVPCVATEVGDVRRLLGDTGILVPPRDSTALAAGLGHLIEIGSDERRRRGEAARTRIEQLFSLDLVTRQYEALYQETVERGRSDCAQR